MTYKYVNDLIFYSRNMECHNNRISFFQTQLKNPSPKK